MTKIKKIESQPEGIVAGFLECVIMPNGEVVSMGKSLGWYDKLKEFVYERVEDLSHLAPSETGIDWTLLDDDELIYQKEESIGRITKGQGTALDKDINELLEIERELTLRESK